MQALPHTHTHTRAPQRNAAEPGSPHAVRSATAAWELRIFCLLQHVNALRGGRSQGKPLVVSATLLEWDTSFPSLSNQSNPSGCTRARTDPTWTQGTRSRGDTSRLPRAHKINKGDPESVALRHKCEQRTPPRTGSELTFPPPARLNRPLKVGGRIKTDEGGKHRQKSMSDTVRLRPRQPQNRAPVRIKTLEQRRSSRGGKVEILTVRACNTPSV